MVLYPSYVIFLLFSAQKHLKDIFLVMSFKRFYWKYYQKHSKYMLFSVLVPSTTINIPKALFWKPRFLSSYRVQKHVLVVFSKTPKCMQSKLYGRKKTCLLNVFSCLRTKTLKCREKKLHGETKYYCQKRVFWMYLTLLRTNMQKFIHFTLYRVKKRHSQKKCYFGAFQR